MFIVDLGFSSAKWLYGNSKGMVKSCYRKTKENGYTFQNENYVIGERALLQTGSNYIRTVEELVEFYPLFVSVCAKKANIETNEEMLVVGLPYDYWKSEINKKQDGALNVIDTLISGLATVKLNNSVYDFTEVYVYPQGLGGIKTYLANNPYNYSGNILACDIGFNTVISTFYSCDEREILTGKTYYKKGLHDMAVNLLMPEIQKHIQGKTLTPIEINHIIQTGNIQVGFDLIDIKPEIENAADTYINDLLSLIVGDLKANGGVITFQTILFFGGGARWLKGKLESQRVKVVVIEEPEYANAIGFKIKAEEVIA